jgi:hypothetical protein
MSTITSQCTLVSCNRKFNAVRNREFTISFRSVTSEAVVEACKQDSELGLGAQKNTRGQPVKN